MVRLLIGLSKYNCIIPFEYFVSLLALVLVVKIYEKNYHCLSINLNFGWNKPIIQNNENFISIRDILLNDSYDYSLRIII